MKTSALFFALAIIALRADDTPPAVPDSAPGEGFPPQRYQDLWTKSPFAVETPEETGGSPDYSLAGVAVIGGQVLRPAWSTSRASSISSCSSDKATRGLTLSFREVRQKGRGHDGGG